ncbi:MICAL-like protein 1 isoform X1 [Misgurnus anguillicaudatus]|uniref:MICAL-like protein 1 isoform X1 n=2 Tax=Misgurnus anguillicaudatus TaxID=75329 RepID=UPI003CCFC4AF
MSSLKALQDWCRIQCESYTDVDIKNMSSSFRDGLAFCAIIHRHRPDLIDFDSLSKENVYENNRLAFEVAEHELNIPALLDPEDMVSMSVPDRLSIITYVSQYYNFFTNKYHENSTCMKRTGYPPSIEPVKKRPLSPLEKQATVTEGASCQSKSCTISSSCLVCGKHVHLVERVLTDSRLYHRNCFRCAQCNNTLLPGSYKVTESDGLLVCTHHFTKSTSQYCHPDLRNQLAPVISNPKDPPSRSIQSIASHTDVNASKRGDEESEREEILTETLPDCSSKEETELIPSRFNSLPNPFVEKEETVPEDNHRTAADVTSDILPTKPVKSTAAQGQPIPKPRQVFESSPAPRPLPRPRPSKNSESSTFNGDPNTHGELVPVLREKSHSPAGKATDTPKAKDPPWLALVQSEPKKKPAPPPPTITSMFAHTGSVSSLKEGGSKPVTALNPFDDEDNDDGVAETSSELPQCPMVANHPWYSITQGDKDKDGDNSRKSHAPSQILACVQRKKRPAPQAPKSSSALRKESISSSYSDCSAVTQQPAAQNQNNLFMKSVSEPSINTSTSAPSPDTQHQAHCSPSLSPAPPPTGSSSVPGTPETSRSMILPPSHRSEARNVSPSSQTPSTPIKQTCKENPFNRKATTSFNSPVSRRHKEPGPARPPAPGHGFPLIKRKVQSDQYIPVEDVHVEINDLEKHLDELEKRGVDLEKRLRDCSNDDEEEHLLVDWFTLIHEKHLLVRREAELVYTAKQHNLEERQADVEYELRCLLNKPEKEWTEDDKDRDQQLMAELVTIIEQRNQIINNIDQDRQREEEEDKLVAAILKKKEFHGESEQKKKAAKFKPIKVLKRLSTKSEGVKGNFAKKENR